MRSLPGMKAVRPGDPVEARELPLQRHRMEGPVYFRLGRNGEPDVHADAENARFGRAKASDGKDAALYSMRTMKPLGSEKMADLASPKVL